MHTTHELTGDAFEYRCDGTAAARGEVMPPISIGDRLGIVMDDPTDGLGAGNFVLSCVTAFYDRFRERTEEFYEYPDYYTFQASSDTVDYQEFDIWPAHKNVSVARDPETVLREINHRAITVLLVADNATGPPEIDDVTLNSATRRIDSCYLYAPDGDLDDADFSIALPRDPAVKWYRKTGDATDDESRHSVRSGSDETHIRQRFRRIDLSEALDHLPASDDR